MKSSKKIIASALAFSMLTGLVANASAQVQKPVTASAATIDDTCDDWLHAQGSRLYDINGNEVWLTGANWFGFNCSENCAHGLYAADVDVFLAACADHGINLIRFPISSELLLSWMNGTPNPVSSVQAGYEPPQDIVGENGSVTPAGTYVNINKDFVLEDGKTLKSSMEIFDIIMQKCKQYGLKAMIDIHSPHTDNSGHNYELWYGKADITTELWIDTLVWLADKYANDDTIIGYDLKNEPHGKRAYDATCPTNIAKWDNTTDENNWAYAATTCANAILEVNPNALIFVEGVEQYPKTELGYTYDTPDIWGASAEASPWYGAWWGGNLRGVRDYPITPDTGTSQIVYSPHDYGPSVYAQTWFDKDFTTQTLLDDYWYDTWAYIEDEDIAPLLIGEWGGHMDGGKNQKWMELLRDYMIDNHISHTFWCLNPNSGDTGGLLGYDFLTWDDAKYTLFEESLWQTQETGQYIGLDHQTALGVNGLSLNEFYTDYAHTEGSNLDGGTVLAAAGNPVIVDGSSSGGEEAEEYTISKNADMCEITVSATKAEEGEKVTFSYTPDADAELSYIKVTTASGNELLFSESNGVCSFTMPDENVTISVVCVISSLPEIVYGDANGDGVVDAIDGTMVTRYAVGRLTLSDAAMISCDVNNDGTVDAIDATIVVRYAVGRIPSLPV